MKAEIVYFYAFDVAGEIASDKVRDILASTPVRYEIRTDHTLPKDIPLYQPLAIEADPLAQTLSGLTVRPHIRIYDVGVVSIAMRVTVDVASLHDLTPLHDPVLSNGRSLDRAALELCAATCRSIQDAMLQPSPVSEPEAYTVFCLTEADGAQDANAWLAENRRAVAELLTENAPDSLSDMQINEVMRICHSYTKKDIAVIDWDAALIVDFGGYVEDTLYVLELANLQLEEYRLMDHRLDHYLDKAYEDIRARRFGLFNAYPAIMPALRALRLDVTRLNDEVTHITKFLGDWSLARVYMGARERFHLNQWRTSVEERLRQLDDLYTVVQTEISNARMLWLEILIAVFFAIDLFSIFFLKK